MVVPLSGDASDVLTDALGGVVPGPGLIAGVVTAGGLLASRATGCRAIGSGDVLSEDTAFYMASVSKQFTAICVHMACDEGALSLADPVRTFVPEFPIWADDVRIEHLMSHSADLPDYGALIEATGRSLDEPFGDDLVIEVLASSAGPAVPPGTRVVYSNTGFLLLAIVLGRATGESLRSFADSRVFGPLGISDTRYRDDHREPIPNLADGHTELDGALARVDSCFDRVGDGGMISTLADWARWESTLLAHREPWASLAGRLEEPFVLADGSVSAWRSGVVVEDVAGRSAVLAGGTGLGYRAFSVRLPDAGFSVCCIANLETADVRGPSLRIASTLSL